MLYILSFQIKLFANFEGDVSHESIRIIWDHKAEQWNKFVGRDGKRDLNRKLQSDPVMMSFIGDASEKVVLDAGCGTGYLSREILNNSGAKRVIGVDISGEMIRIARENNRNIWDLSFEVDNISTLESVADNSVDIIVSNYVLMDVPDLEGALRAFRRVLKPFGKVIFTILHPCFPLANHKYNDSHKTVQYSWDTSYFESHIMSVPEFSEEFDSSFTVFHRPLGEYISLFIENGFTLRYFKEPVIQELQKQEINEKTYELFRRSPLSAVFGFELNEFKNISPENTSKCCFLTMDKVKTQAY